MQHAIKILRDIPIVRNRQKDALRDKAVFELNEAIKFALNRRDPIPRLRIAEKQIEELEASTNTTEGKRRFGRMLEMINFAITKLRGGRLTAPPRQPAVVARGPRSHQARPRLAGPEPGFPETGHQHGSLSVGCP